MTRPAVSIGVAVVEHDGFFLIGTRPEGVALAGYAEFPGGKFAPGETPEACAIRECREETGLLVEAVRTLDRTRWDYPHGRVDLWFVLCGPASGQAPLDPRPPFRWVRREDLAALRFPEANAAVVASLCR